MPPTARPVARTPFPPTTTPHHNSRRLRYRCLLAVRGAFYHGRALSERQRRRIAQNIALVLVHPVRKGEAGVLELHGREIEKGADLGAVCRDESGDLGEMVDAQIE